MIRFTEPGGVSAWLSIVRDERDFSAGTSTLLEAICPHLRRALSSYLAIERERFRADVTAGAMKRLNFGWFGMDADRRITGANDRMERLLAQSPHLRRDGQGRLYASQPAVHQQLCEAMETCPANRSTRPRAIHISTDPWLELLIVPVEDRPASASPVPVAIAYIQDSSPASVDNHEQISELFGLTRSEARLALAMSRGMTIAQAASALGFTLETTRNYSKKIYAKTGARGQADLIRLMLGGVLALA
ncbi:helix-turn-helix transcriptional regulator [Sphingobium tyrosinilyticum]|uniref:Helix-turn-helix transcriptional regulator n=2 Tax=Sphingobium tyrosinilyticum TaxID=2715436 RepID=A0ABV9F0E8_9SPHN